MSNEILYLKTDLTTTAQNYLKTIANSSVKKMEILANDMFH